MPPVQESIGIRTSEHSASEREALLDEQAGQIGRFEGGYLIYILLRRSDCREGIVNESAFL